MKISSERVLDALEADEPCLGAVFTSYGFNPAFFEDHVLRTVLRLASDPVEHPGRYHDEARRALQQVPLVAIVDAGERQPGRRLPYDLLEVSRVVFHPKSVLVLYREHARFLVGSGNLTPSGYGGNAELFIMHDLDYGGSEDAALLWQYYEHLEQLIDLVRRPGSLLRLVQSELSRRLGDRRSIKSKRFALLDSTKAPVIEQLESLLPKTAVIDSIGMLAPFFERDDGSEIDARSVFGALGRRLSGDAVLDVGVSWENAQVAPVPETTPIGHGLGRLWAWVYDEDDGPVVEYLVPTSIGGNQVNYIDESGRAKKWSLKGTESAIRHRELWMLPEPVAFAPRKALESSRRWFGDVRLWLFPSTRLVGEAAVHRPLHAKVLLVGFRTANDRGTIVVMGSPNMSRRALLQKASPGGGNVELAMAFRLSGKAALRDLVPGLVRAPPIPPELREREFPERGPNFGLALEQALHDPSKRTLEVTWAEQAADLPAWRLTYCDRELAGGEVAPTEAVLVADFDLSPSSAEVVLHIAAEQFSCPILVTDLLALPISSAAGAITIDELLMLLSRRIGRERIVQIAECRSGEGTPDEINLFFGDGFGPTDVFRAWWSVARDLGDPALSVQAFRLVLDGSLGVGTVWLRMVESLDGSGELQSIEVWFYGAELLRTLRQVELADAPDRVEKERLLDAFCAEIESQLAKVPLGSEDLAWVRDIRDFFGIELR